MKCKQVQLWLLTADGNSPASSGLRRHLYDCVRCRRERQRVLRLDDAVRRLPFPPGNADTQTKLWERIGPALPPPLPARPVYLPWRRVLRWAAAAVLLFAVGWPLVRHFLPPRGAAPSPAPQLTAEGHQLWVGPEDKSAVLLVARHDVRLAETTDVAEQLEVLAALAADLKDKAVEGVRAGKTGNLPLLATLYEQVVRQGIAGRVAALPPEKKPAAVNSLTARLRTTATEVAAVAGASLPVVAEMLRPLCVVSRESADRLEAERSPTLPAATIATGPAPLLTALVHQGLRLAEETDLVRRADLCAELASFLAPAVVLLSTGGDAGAAQELSECMSDMLEFGAADSLEAAGDAGQGRQEDVEKVLRRSAQAVAVLERNLSQVPEAARAGLRQALDAAQLGDDRVREVGAAQGKGRAVGPPWKLEADKGGNEKGKMPPGRQKKPKDKPPSKVPPGHLKDKPDRGKNEPQAKDEKANR